jgi:hypothetical protein
MTQPSTKSAPKAASKPAPLKLKKETLRDLKVTDSADKVQGGACKSNFCDE